MANLQRLLKESQAHPGWNDALDFLAANPDLFDAIVEVIETAKAIGRKKIGINFVIEHLRWKSDIERGFTIASDDSYLLNNNMSPLIARAVVLERPDLVEMLDFRRLRS